MTIDRTIELTPQQEEVLRMIQCNHTLYPELNKCGNAIYCHVVHHGYEFEGYICMAKHKGLPCDYEVITVGKSNIRDTVAGSSP